MFLAALIALPIFAAPAYSLDLSARSETRVRVPGDQALDGKIATDSWDTEIGAVGNLGIDFRDTKLRIGYAPKLTLNDFTHQALENIWQTGTLAVTWLWPRVELGFTEVGAYGDHYYSALSNVQSTDPATGGLVIQAQPRSVSVRDVMSDSMLRTTLTISPDDIVNMLVGYQLGGGVNGPSRDVLPFYTAARGFASLEHKLSFHDSLISAAQASETRTSTPVPPEVHTFIGIVMESWRRRWAAGTTSNAGVGLAIIPAYLPDQPLRARPTALVNLSQRVVTGPGHATLQLTLTGSVDVVVDRLTGQPDTRAQTGLGGLWTTRKWGFLLQAGYARSLSTTEVNAVAVATGEARVSFNVSHRLRVETAGRVLDQKVLAPAAGPGVLVAPGLQWAALAALTYRFDVIEF